MTSLSAGIKLSKKQAHLTAFELMGKTFNLISAEPLMYLYQLNSFYLMENKGSDVW